MAARVKPNAAKISGSHANLTKGPCRANHQRKEGQMFWRTIRRR